MLRSRLLTRPSPRAAPTCTSRRWRPRSRCRTTSRAWKLQLSAETTAEIFSGTITNWDDAAIKADNPRRSSRAPRSPSCTAATAPAPPRTSPASSPRRRRRRGRSAGQHGELAGGHAGRNGQLRCRRDRESTDGAIGYVDFSDAKASDLTYASIKNSAGKFISPSLESASPRREGATVNADLTYDPINSDRREGVPDHLADVDHRVPEPDRRSQGQRDQGLAELHLRRRPEAGSVGRLRAAVAKGLLKQAKAQVKKITVPAS